MTTIGELALRVTTTGAAEGEKELKNLQTQGGATERQMMLPTGTPGKRISMALPLMCWLSLATPRLTLASQALLSGERKADRTSTVPLTPAKTSLTC